MKWDFTDWKGKDIRKRGNAVKVKFDYSLQFILAITNRETVQQPGTYCARGTDLQTASQAMESYLSWGQNEMFVCTFY